MSLHKIIYPLVMTLLILLSIGLHIFQAFHSHINNKKLEQMDQDFVFSVLNVGQMLNSTSNMNLNYTAAIEYANQAQALAKYTSYAKDDLYVDTYTRRITHSLRERLLNQMEITNDTELRSLFNELAQDPTNHDIADKIVQILKPQ